MAANLTAGSAKSVAGKHLGYLDGVRAVAAIYVVFHHAYLQANFFNGQEPLTHFRRPIKFFAYGHYAVDLFIVLSGFCLMLPVLRSGGVIRHGAFDFFKRRAWRIIPPYYFSIALSLVLIWLFIHQKTGTHWDVSIPVTEKGILTHLVLLQDAVGEDVTINHALWSVAVEWRIYFLFPLLVWGWRRLGATPTTLLAVAGSIVLFYVCGLVIGASLSAHYLGLFAMGMLGARLAFAPVAAGAPPGRWPWGWTTALLAGIVVFLTDANLWRGQAVPVYIMDYFVGACSASFLVMVSRHEANWLTRILNLPPVVFVGTFAYSIYLIHAPLLQILWQDVFTPLQTKPTLMFVALSLVGTPLIVGLSYLFFLTCERPFLSQRRIQSQES